MKGCSNCSVVRCNRREFLNLTVGALVTASLSRSGVAVPANVDLPKHAPVKIFCVFAGRTGHWYLTRPAEEIPKFRKFFAELERKLKSVHGTVKFVGTHKFHLQTQQKLPKGCVRKRMRLSSFTFPVTVAKRLF